MIKFSNLDLNHIFRHCLRNIQGLVSFIYHAHLSLEFGTDSFVPPVFSVGAIELCDLFLTAQMPLAFSAALR
jgi:hypothetical protein